MRSHGRMNRMLDELTDRCRGLEDRLARIEAVLGVDFPEKAEHWRSRR